MSKLLKKLPDTFGSDAAFRLGISPYCLSKLVKSGLIERIYRGVYRKTGGKDQGLWSHYEVASKKVVKKNAVCLLSALEYHHLSETMLNYVWLLVDQGTRSKKEGICLFRRRSPRWDIGMIKNKNFMVTNLERSLVESLVFKKKVGPNESFYALKTALTEKKTKVSKILKMAEKLDLRERIQPLLDPYIYG